LIHDLDGPTERVLGDGSFPAFGIALDGYAHDGELRAIFEFDALGSGCTTAPNWGFPSDKGHTSCPKNRATRIVRGEKKA